MSFIFQWATFRDEPYGSLTGCVLSVLVPGGLEGIGSATSVLYNVALMGVVLLLLVVYPLSFPLVVSE